MGCQNKLAFSQLGQVSGKETPHLISTAEKPRLSALLFNPSLKNRMSPLMLEELIIPEKHVPHLVVLLVLASLPLQIPASKFPTIPPSLQNLSPRTNLFLIDRHKPNVPGSRHFKAAIAGGVTHLKAYLQPQSLASYTSMLRPCACAEGRACT